MNDTLAHNLLIFRNRRDLSQSQLAELTGLEPSAISHFEKGRRSPSCKNLVRLADALEVTIDELFGREGGRAASPLSLRVMCAMSRMKRQDQESLAAFAEIMADRAEGLQDRMHGPITPPAE